jgi:hypothetical protein
MAKSPKHPAVEHHHQAAAFHHAAAHHHHQAAHHHSLTSKMKRRSMPRLLTNIAKALPVNPRAEQRLDRFLFFRRAAFLHFGNQSLAPLGNPVENATLVVFRGGGHDSEA